MQSLSINRIPVTSTLFFLLAIHPFSIRAIANPSDKMPKGPLNAHGTIVGAKEMTKQLYSVHVENDALARSPEAKDANRIEEIAIDEFIKSCGATWKGSRDARRLKLMGEPAGYDLDPALSGLHKHMMGVCDAYGKTRKGQILKMKTAKRLSKSLPKLKKTIERAEQMLSRKQYDAFEKLMESEGVKLTSDVAIFHHTERGKYTLNFDKVLARGDSEIEVIRRKEYLAIAGKTWSKQMEIVAAFPGEVIRIKKSVSKGVVDDDQRALEGGLEELTRAWGKASAAIQRANAIGVAFDPSARNGGGSARIDPKIDSAAKQLQGNAIKAFAALIGTASDGVPVADLSKVYSEALEKISVAQRRIGRNDRSLIEACQPALEQLAAKNPALVSQAAAYTQAVSQPLRWRERFATEMSLQLAKGYPEAGGFLASETEVPTGTRGYRPGKHTIAPDYLSSWSHYIMPAAGPRLVGQSVSDRSSLRLTPSKPLGVVPFGEAHYTNVVLSIPSEKEAKDLQAAILVSDTFGPLTMEAADASSSAKLGEYTAVGGVIKGVYMEPRLVRFAKLPDMAYVLAPLGTLPSFHDQRYSPMQALCWRLDVQATWLHHKYFTVAASE